LQGRRLQRVAAERLSDRPHLSTAPIDYRRYDLKVVQAVHEAVKDYAALGPQEFPLCPQDDLVSLLGIDPEDVEDLVAQVAKRCKRRLPRDGKNPQFIVPTVLGVIEFLNNLPQDEA